MLGGQLEAMSPLIDSPYESPPSSLDGNGIAHFMTANDIDLEALEAAEPTADTRWDKEIPMLLKRVSLPLFGHGQLAESVDGSWARRMQERGTPRGVPQPSGLF